MTCKVEGIWHRVCLCVHCSIERQSWVCIHKQDVCPWLCCALWPYGRRVSRHNTGLESHPLETHVYMNLLSSSVHVCSCVCVSPNILTQMSTSWYSRQFDSVMCETKRLQGWKFPFSPFSGSYGNFQYNTFRILEDEEIMYNFIIEVYGTIAYK